MLLNKKYRYIWLDFETTGLDVTKDEPIQIGLIEIDETGNIINEYQSLIKPTKKTDELKHIVGFITGLSIQELETAPTRDEILPQIENFFGENTIIIGHNIGFDLNFLKAYFPSLSYHSSIDTMQLAQTIMHYTPSYALEILIDNLKNEKLFNEIFKNNNHGEEKAHDAFFDTKNSIKLFLYFIKYVHKLIQSYPNLAHIINQTEGTIKESINIQVYENIPKVKVKFPALEKIAPSQTSVARNEESIDTKKLENQKRYYIGNIPIKELLKALAVNKNIILAFQNIQKLDIAKAVLNEIGIKNIGFTKEEQTINQELFEKFLNKWEFIQEECLFIIKYLSHLKKWLGVLNLNNQYDYRIYYYIKDTRNQSKYPIILTTHHGLFTSITENEDLYKDYDICFLDTEQRYKTYNFRLSSPIDLYYTLNILESFIYQKKIDAQIQSNAEISNELQEFVNLFQTFIGVLFMESKKLFIKTENTMIQHDPLRDHGDFYQTNLLRKQLIEKKEPLKTILSEDNYKLFDRHISNITKTFNSIVNIFKKMYGNSDFYFTYAESQKYTDRKEFIDVFKNKVIFFSNTNKQSTPLIEKETKKELQTIKTIPPKIDVLIDYITKDIEKNSEEISYFIFSPKKEESKKIFEDLCQKGIHEKAMLLIENITGGMGKNIFKAKQTKNKILIWWYNFILYCYANKIPFKEIIIFNAKWPSEQNIIDDIKRYNILN